MTKIQKILNQKRSLVMMLSLLLFVSSAQAQQSTPAAAKNRELKWALNEDGSQFIKFTFLNQVWVRWNQSNPGTTVYGTSKASTYDVGLRRTRVQLIGQLSDRVFLYMQFGQNNFTYNSPRKLGTFFHDAVAEYRVSNGNQLSIGAGLSGWSGYARFASPSVGSILGLDAPLFEQATNDVSDQFLRKLGLYAKGKLGKLDYRLALSNPMVIQTSATFRNEPISSTASFSTLPPKLQYQAYLMYQFLDQESNQLAYNTGSYLGKKRVLNLGAGIIYQPQALWRLGAQGDTIKTAMRLWAVDLFYDAPLQPEKGTAISAYLGYFNNDFGYNYVRNLGVMNPADGVKPGKGSFNGAGNAFPMEGTGSVIYAQAGYLCKKDLLGSRGTLQPYASMMYGRYKRLSDPVVVWDAGVNWLINGHNAKMTLGWQSRPVFNSNAGKLKVGSRRSMLVLQYQIFI